MNNVKGNIIIIFLVIISLSFNIFTVTIWKNNNLDIVKNNFEEDLISSQNLILGNLNEKKMKKNIKEINDRYKLKVTSIEYLNDIKDSGLKKKQLDDLKEKFKKNTSKAYVKGEYIKQYIPADGDSAFVINYISKENEKEVNGIQTKYTKTIGIITLVHLIIYISSLLIFNKKISDFKLKRKVKNKEKEEIKEEIKDELKEEIKDELKGKKKK